MRRRADQGRAELPEWVCGPRGELGEEGWQEWARENGWTPLQVLMVGSERGRTAREASDAS